MNPMHPLGSSRARFSQPQSTTRVRYIQVVRKNNAIPYEQMLKELTELQARIELEHDEALRYFSGLYSNMGFFPRLLSPADISKRLSRLIMVEAQYTRDARTVKRFMRLLDLGLKNQSNSGGLRR